MVCHKCGELEACGHRIDSSSELVEVFVVGIHSQPSGGAGLVQSILGHIHSEPGGEARLVSASIATLFTINRGRSEASHQSSVFITSSSVLTVSQEKRPSLLSLLVVNSTVRQDEVLGAELVSRSLNLVVIFHSEAAGGVARKSGRVLLYTPIYPAIGGFRVRAY